MGEASFLQNSHLVPKDDQGDCGYELHFCKAVGESETVEYHSDSQSRTDGQYMPVNQLKTT